MDCTTFWVYSSTTSLGKLTDHPHRPEETLLLLVHPPVTFLGAPCVPAIEGSGADFAFVGVPCTTDYEGDGRLGPSAGAPNAVRAASLEFEYHRLLDHYDFDCGGVVMPAGVSLVDVGNVAC